MAGANAASIFAASASQSDVNAAIALSHSGDNVFVPPGTATWTASGFVNYVLIPAGVGLFGSPNHATIINTSGTGPWVAFAASNGVPTHLSGFTFNDNGSDNGFGIVAPSGYNVRVSSNVFNFTMTALWVNGNTTTGVADHNQFNQTAPNGSANGLVFFGATSPNDAIHWNGGVHWGDTNYFFAENNGFNYINPGNGAYDTYAGAWYVFRYNFITNTWMGMHGLDSGGFRSPHSGELYGNLWVLHNNIAELGQIRGGSVLVYSNNIIKDVGVTLNGGFQLRYYRVFDANAIFNWGPIDNSNALDGNTDGGGYPGRDQPGRTGPTTTFIDHTVQPISPCLAWSNVLNGVLFSAMGNGTTANVNPPGDSESQLLVQGRDYTNASPIAVYGTNIPIQPYPHYLIALTQLPGSRIARVTTLRAGKTVVGP